jgi:hypothetical protein
MAEAVKVVITFMGALATAERTVYAFADLIISLIRAVLSHLKVSKSTKKKPKLGFERDLTCQGFRFTAPDFGVSLPDEVTEQSAKTHAKLVARMVATLNARMETTFPFESEAVDAGLGSIPRQDAQEVRSADTTLFEELFVIPGSPPATVRTVFDQIKTGTPFFAIFMQVFNRWILFQLMQSFLVPPKEFLAFTPIFAANGQASADTPGPEGVLIGLGNRFMFVIPSSGTQTEAARAAGTTAPACTTRNQKVKMPG